MKTITIATLLFISLPSYSQEIYTGKVIDIDSKETLPYVNIGIIGKNIGTVSNINGDFKIELSNKYDTDSIKLSMVGYKHLIFKVSNFKNEIRKNPSFQLQARVSELREIVVSNRTLKTKILGNKTKSTAITGGFPSNELGSEVGIKIKIKKSPTYIKNFNTYITKNEYGVLIFRLNFYDLKNGLPDKHILRENIIVETQIKKGLLTVDLSNYDIVVYEDFFVSLEWIENLGPKDGLYFSAGFLGSSIIVRNTSQDKWGKIGGISIGFNVTAKY